MKQSLNESQLKGVIFEMVLKKLDEMSGDDYISMAENYGVEPGSKLEDIILSGADGMSPEDIDDLVNAYIDDPNSDELDAYLS